jgi:hypothetical protein
MRCSSNMSSPINLLCLASSQLVIIPINVIFNRAVV